MEQITAAELLGKINEALKAANDAEAIVTTAQADLTTAHAELVSRSKALGELLLEAKKLHPAKKDFAAFLRGVNGLHISRAYDLLRLAGGRATDEDLRQEARERQRKSRSKRKLPKPEPQPESVTGASVTDSPEISIEERKAQMASLDLAAQKATKASARALAEFVVACRYWLPKITAEADRQRARLLVSELTSNKNAEAA
jgi:hypothetical protein